MVLPGGSFATFAEIRRALTTRVAKRIRRRNKEKNTRPAAVQELWDRAGNRNLAHRLMPDGEIERLYSKALHSPPA
jgi:hypothetical protein